MRNYLGNFNLFAFSANLQQTALGTPQTIDTTFQCDRGSVFNLKPRRETNADALTGHHESDRAYNLGNLAEMAITFNRAEAQHFAWLYAFALGSSTPTAWGTGYKHLDLPTEEMILPCGSGIFRYGKRMAKRRFADVFVESLTATFAKDSWAKIEATLKATGKYDDSVTSEQITAAYNVTSLTLAASAVQGSSASERLDSIHLVRVLVPTTGEWKDVVCTAASGATPAVLTIEAPGVAATSTTYEVIYVPTEAAWATFPARVDESPLRVSDLTFKFGGKYNTSTYVVDGGHTIGAEISSIAHTITNETPIEFRVGGTGSYANYAILKDRTQTLKLDREMRDHLLQYFLQEDEYFAVQATATGVEFETGKNFYVDLIFPRVSILDAPISVADKVIAEAGDFHVHYDATAGFSCRAEIANQVAGYAQ